MLARQTRSRLVAAALGIAATSGGALGAATWTGRIPWRSAAATSPPVGFTPRDDQPYIEEIAVLVGSYTCSASSYPGLPERTHTLIDSLRRAATARGNVFATIGVAIDGPRSRGEAWLDKFGSFDEIVVGRNWMNSAVAHYIWSDPDALPAIPQLVLVTHRVSPSPRVIRVGADSVVKRWVGGGTLLRRTPGDSAS
jgi:hypothetical protein